MSISLIHFNHIMRNGHISWAGIDAWEWKPNYGDMLVCAAILRQIDSIDPINVQFGYRAPKSFDYALLRGSTYLHNEFDFKSAIETIESFDCPVYCVGLGAQSNKLDPSYLDNNNDARRFVEILSERSKSISCRGVFTAQVLERLGAKSLRVTGCPSLFYLGSPQDIKISPLLETFGRIGVSIHTELSNNIFCRNAPRTLALHGDLIRFLEKNNCQYRIFEQGNEIELKIAYKRYGIEVQRDAAQIVIKRIGLDGAMMPDQLIARFCSVLTVEEWISKARDLDSMIGFRFHGNMVALMQGMPCFYYVYDSRLHEFCELYKLPYQNVESEFCSPIEMMINHDWENVNKAIIYCYNELREFYRENGVGVSEVFT